MIQIKVMLFARAKDLLGRDSLSVELPDDASVQILRERMQHNYPRLSSLLEKCAIAVNGEFAGPDQLLEEHSEVAILPPVSGG